MGYYHTFLTDGLFIEALKLNSADFMRVALKLEAFDKQIYNKKLVITTMLSFFESDGSKTNFILNVLLLIDISQWRLSYIKELIEKFENYITEEYINNRLLLSFNPLMSIAMTCDLLRKIGDARRQVKE